MTVEGDKGFTHATKNDIESLRAYNLTIGDVRTALERHQTLFALIEWSYNLLTEPERVLLNRLSVFAGGWTFEAAQAVCSEGLAEDVLDLLTRLVDKSLVNTEDVAGEMRYRYLETIRQYARESVVPPGRVDRTRSIHRLRLDPVSADEARAR